MNLARRHKAGDILTLGQPFKLRTDQCQAQLRIIATTDLHFQLMSWDYLADRPSPGTGLARAAALIRALRAAVPNALLFDNGDFLQGSPLSDWVAESRARGETGIHPMIGAMNALNYDAGTLGNHEFNYGLAFLTEALSWAAFPIVSANILRRDGQTYVAPTVLLDRIITDGRGQTIPIRIGVIGLAPPQITQWDGVELDGAIVTEDIVASAAAHVPALRAAGADIVVALAHTGIGPDAHVAGMENAAVPLAAIPGIDAIIAGHTHQIFPGPDVAASPSVDPDEGRLHGVPAVMPGFHGSHVGVIDLLIEHEHGRWRVLDNAARVIPVADAPAMPAMPEGPTGPTGPTGPDPFLDALAAMPHRSLLADIRREVGQTRVAMHGFFSLVVPDLTLQIVADAQRERACALLHDRAGHGPDDDLPILSAISPFHAGGRGGSAAYVDIPAGALCRRHASELYVFPNRLCVLTMTGAQIADWLEHAAGLFCTITPGRTDQPLIDPAFPSYNFDVFDGLTYTIDPAVPPRYDPQGLLLDPAATRIGNLCRDGQPLDRGARFLVVTNSYRAGGGGGAQALAQARLVLSDDRGVRDSVLAYLGSHSPFAPLLRPSWSFADHPGTAAWFDTGPVALSRAAPPGVTPLGPAPGGFHRFAQSFDAARHRQVPRPAP